MSKEDLHILQNDAIDLLKNLIAIPSFSKEEDKTASLIEQFLQSKNVTTQRFLNNTWAKNKYFDDVKAKEALNIPAGAYYRVMHRNVRDMHAALNEQDKVSTE